MFITYHIIGFTLFSLIEIVQGNVFKQKCAAAEECDKTKGLTCGKDGVCECINATSFWSDKPKACGSKYSLLHNLTNYYSENFKNKTNN